MTCKAGSSILFATLHNAAAARTWWNALRGKGVDAFAPTLQAVNLNGRYGKGDFRISDLAADHVVQVLQPAFLRHIDQRSTRGSAGRVGGQAGDEIKEIGDETAGDEKVLARRSQSRRNRSFRQLTKFAERKSRTRSTKSGATGYVAIAPLECHASAFASCAPNEERAGDAVCSQLPLRNVNLCLDEFRPQA